MRPSVVMRFCIRGGFFLALCVMGSIYFSLYSVFTANFYFNGCILGIWLFSIGLVFYEFIKLFSEERNLYKRKNFSILLPLIRLYERSPYANQSQITSALQTCRDNLSYVMLGYLIRALIFVGILGTLWGLSKTISLIAEVMTDIMAQLPAEDMTRSFLEISKDHLEKLLIGMKIAFSPTLFGILGFITINFLQIQLEEARKYFFQEAGEWSLTLFKRSEEVLPSGKENIFLQSTLSQWLEGVERLGHINYLYEKRQDELCAVLMSFAEKTNSLSELMKAQYSILNKWADEQLQSRHTLERIAQKLHDSAFSGDETIKNYLNQLAVICGEILKCVSRDGEHIRHELQTLHRITKENRLR